MCYRQYEYGGAGNWRGQNFSNQAPVNISETDDSYTIKLFAPGLNKQNINVRTQNDILSIRYKGEMASESGFTRREYRIEEIDRSFDLKGKVVVEAITATYAEGVLTVELPKNEAAKRPSQQVGID